MQYDKSIKNINRILEKYSLGFLETGVKWVVIHGTSDTSCSRYDIRTDTIYIHPDDIGWSWAAGSNTYAIMFHELSHRILENFFTRKQLKEKSITELFGYYHRKYIRRLRYASKMRKRDLVDYVSRYAVCHEADDMSETLSVCLQYLLIKDKDPKLFVKEHNKSKKCLQKITVIMKLIDELKSREIRNRNI